MTKIIAIILAFMQQAVAEAKAYTNHQIVTAAHRVENGVLIIETEVSGNG